MFNLFNIRVFKYCPNIESKSLLLKYLTQISSIGYNYRIHRIFSCIYRPLMKMLFKTVFVICRNRKIFVKDLVTMFFKISKIYLIVFFSEKHVYFPVLGYFLWNNPLYDLFVFFGMWVVSKIWLIKEGVYNSFTLKLLKILS